MTARAERIRFPARRPVEFQFGQRRRGLRRPVLKQRIPDWSFWPMLVPPYSCC
jgi:hypothetical protein